MNTNVASIANAKVIYLYFHLKTCRTVVNSGTGLKQLCTVNFILHTLYCTLCPEDRSGPGIDLSMACVTSTPNVARSHSTGPTLLCIVQCTLSSLLCTLFCKVSTVQCTLYSCTVDTVLRALYSVHCSVCTLLYTAVSSVGNGQCLKCHT